MNRGGTCSVDYEDGSCEVCQEVGNPSPFDTAMSQNLKPHINPQLRKSKD
jgi:hypothetical protein